MAIPKVQQRDKVEVVFQKQSEMYKKASGTLYASSRANDNSEISEDTQAFFLLAGGAARVSSYNDSSITFTCVDDEDNFDDAQELRVERKFIKSLQVVSRLTAVVLDDDLSAMVPDSPDQDLEIWEGGYCENYFTPSDVRSFLKEVKKHYYKKKVKKKKKKAKKKPKKKAAPKPFKKGLKITPKNWKPGMIVNIEAIDWDESDNKLNSTELFLVFKGKFKKTRVTFNFGGLEGLRVIDPTSKSWVDVSPSIIKSITLAMDWTPPLPPPEPELLEEDYPDHELYGNEVGGVNLNYESIAFYEKGMAVGCKQFPLPTIKKLYKALCKVYGEPK